MVQGDFSRSTAGAARRFRAGEWWSDTVGSPALICEEMRFISLALPKSASIFPQTNLNFPLSFGGHFLVMEGDPFIVPSLEPSAYCFGAPFMRAENGL
jgi:hypothetical protein